MDVLEQTIFQASQDCVVCAFGDGVAVLDLRSNTYFTLNPVAAVVWATLESGATIEEILNKVTEDFDVTRDVCLPDIQALLADFSCAGLVESR